MNRSTVLEDYAPTRFVIRESKGSAGASRTSALGVVQRHDTVNGNRRVYPKSFFERLFRPGSKFMERLSQRGVCGHIEHPSDGLPDLRKFAVVMTDCGFYNDMCERYPETKKLNIDDPSTAIIGLFEALSTPDGKIVEALWTDEVQTGASSRAQGSVVTNETQYPQFPPGVDIVQDDVDEETLVWDIVARPSTPGAFPSRVQEAINEAIEDYRLEAQLLETQNISPAIGEGLGGNAMHSLTEIRTRLSRIKPHMENLSRVPGTKLMNYLKEVDSLVESLGTASKSLNESQQLPAADISGELQAVRDRIVAHIEAAFQEAESGKIPGATSMKVADKTTSNFAALNSDPALDYPSSQSMLPGGKAGAGAVQEPDKGTSDQTVPGAGVNPSGDSKLASDQSEEERRKQQHGKMDGDSASGGAGVSGKSMGAKAGTRGESITTDQAHKTTKGELGQDVVKQDEEGDGVEVDDYGRSMSSQGVKAGKTGKEDGSKLQGIVASQDPGDGHHIAEDGGTEMDDDALANLNLSLVKECRALRQENAYLRQKNERANSLVVETGAQFRKQRFKMAMERLIENNKPLDNPQARAVLETARDEKHMVQIAEAIMGTRARMTQAEERQLKLKCESDGFFRLVVDGKPHEKVLDGQTMYEALLRMNLSEEDIDAAFDDAYSDAGVDIDVDVEGEEDATYKKPEGAIGEPYVMVPMEPVDDEMGGEGDMDLELDFGGDDEIAGEIEGGDDTDFGGDEDEDEDTEEVAESCGKKHKKGEPCKQCDAKKDMKEGRRNSFRRYLESRGLAKPRQGRRNLTESHNGGRQRPGRQRPGRQQKVGGSRRMSESLPPAGGAPSSRPPAVGGASAASSAPLSLTERIIAREKAEKQRQEEARVDQKKRMGING